jgi:hypothetical protein
LGEDSREELMLSNLRELIGGVDREGKWIITIGIMGIAFSVVFATTMASWIVLNPLGLLETESLRLIFRTATWIFGVFSVISVIAGIQVLNFIRSWRRNYSNLKAAEKQLEKKYFGN